MTAPMHPPGRHAPLRRQLILTGLLPMTLVALALCVMLGVLHARALGAEALSVARIQAVRLAASLGGASSDDALRDALARTLSRSSPTQRIVLRRDEAPDIALDSGRRFAGSDELRVRLSVPAGELETVSDASALRERRMAGALMCMLLGAGIVAIFMLSRRLLDQQVVRPVEHVRERIDRFLHPRDAHGYRIPGADLPAIEALLDELVELRARHDATMADALRQRLQDIARHTLFIEQIGDHFRQPLHALSLFVAGMQPGEDLRQRAVLGQMRTNLTRLSELLDGLLDMARFDAGAVEPAAVELIAADLFVRVRASIESDASRLGVEVRWRGGRTPLYADPALLTELLRRLVANAVLSTPHGRVLVAVRRRGDAIRLEIRDNGMGLEPSAQARVFEDFTRLPGHPGHGLALALARRIADTLGGTIGVRSRPGRGSLFWVEIDGAAVGPTRRPLALAGHHPIH